MAVSVEMADHQNSNLLQTFNLESLSFDTFADLRYGTPWGGSLTFEVEGEGGDNNIVLGHCKRITVKYQFPENAR